MAGLCMTGGGAEATVRGVGQRVRQMAVTRGGRAELWSPASAAHTPDHRLGTAADDAVSSSQILCRLLCLFEDKDLVDMIQGKMWANCVDIVDTDETQSTGEL